MGIITSLVLLRPANSSNLNQKSPIVVTRSLEIPSTLTSMPYAIASGFVVGGQLILVKKIS